MGINLDGDRDVLGMWVGPGGEGAKFWMTTLTELRNRGIRDTFIVCCDGLKGLPDKIRATCPKPKSSFVSCTWFGRHCTTAPRSTRDASAPSCARSTPPQRPTPPGPLRRVRRDLAGSLPGHDPHLGAVLGRLRAVPRVPRELRTLVYTTDEIVNGSRRVSWVASARASPRGRVRGVQRGRVRGAESRGRCSRSRVHVDRVPRGAPAAGSSLRRLWALRPGRANA